YVTHDQTEALALGDRLAIMRAGTVEQLGDPEQIFEEPATEYVAGFIGMGNRLELEQGGAGWRHDGIEVQGDLSAEERLPDRIVVRARAEDLELAQPDAIPPQPALSLPAVVVDSEFAGRAIDIVVRIGDTRLQSRMAAGERGG